MNNSWDREQRPKTGERGRELPQEVAAKREERERVVTRNGEIARSGKEKAIKKEKKKDRKAKRANR